MCEKIFLIIYIDFLKVIFKISIHMRQLLTFTCNITYFLFTEIFVTPTCKIISSAFKTVITCGLAVLFIEKFLPINISWGIVQGNGF